MPTVVVDVLDEMLADRRRRGGGATIVISDPAGEALRDAMAGAPLGASVPEHSTLLRALAAREADIELRRLVAALERHGAVVVRFLNPVSYVIRRSTDAR